MVVSHVDLLSGVRSLPSDLPPPDPTPAGLRGGFQRGVGCGNSVEGASED